VVHGYGESAMQITCAEGEDVKVHFRRFMKSEDLITNRDGSDPSNFITIAMGLLPNSLD
jgi:hypothetical protein